MAATARNRSVIGVLPSRAAIARPRLLGALEQVFPVRFEGRDNRRLGDLDGAIVFGDGVASEHVRRRGLPCVLLTEPMSPAGARGSGSVAISSGDRIDSRLRGRRFGQTEVPGRSMTETWPGEEILASSSGRPLWVRHPSADANLYAAALTPAELEPGESIRDVLRPKSFMSLLPLVHLIRELTADSAWTAPPLRASFIIDDPNLHWTSYGYVHFERLARHARLHGYHVAMATVPLDLWYANRRAIRIFRDRAPELSLVVHGNDHVRAELARSRSEADALELLTRALARVAKFERRTGLSIDRVMVPPHGDCNDVMFEALARTGFDAISWSPKPRSEISGWDVADFGRGGLPSIPRTLLVDRDDLPFRSYLNQPLVLEGHHSDLDEGLTLLEEAAADVNGLGAVTWRSPGGIAETNFSARRVGDCLHVRLFSRRVVLTIPPGVGHMVVDAPRYELQQDDSVAIRPLAGGGAPASGALREELPVIPGTIELRLTRSPVSDGLPSPGGAIWPYVRRLLTESRDRAQPLTDTLHRGRGTATAAAGT